MVVLFAGLCAFILVSRKDKSGGTAESSQEAPSSSASAGSADDTGTITLLLSNSVAKQTFIDKAVKDFNDKREQVGGKAVVVKVQHGTSGESWDEIK